MISYEGYIPNGYSFWYKCHESDDTDVKSVEQTWWYQVFDGKYNILIRNDSFSGSTVCNTVRPEHTVDVSFVSRFDKLINDGFFEQNIIDTIIIFGYTNDAWTGVPFGEIKYDDFTNQDLLEFSPACAYLASRIKKMLPNVNAFWLLNTDMDEKFSNFVKKIANHFGQKCIEFKKIDKLSGHPSINGMTQIANTIKEH